MNLGELFAGRYLIKSLLGRGGMGEVFLALDQNLEIEVALKTINADLAALPQFRSMLENEARKLARINSPYVPRIYDRAEFQGHMYVAMEYVAGPELRSLISTASLAQKIAIALQIAEGLQDAHRVGLIHRDLKPENIKLNERGMVKILDFGLARLVHSEGVNEKGELEGTTSYMSPEQISTKQLTFASDIFSYGLVMFELFCGRRAFDGTTVVYQILNEQAETPSAIVADVPSWLDELVSKSLVKQPEQRLQSMKDVLEIMTAPAVRESPPPTQQERVLLIELANKSDDPTWSFFCKAFSKQVEEEIARRTNLLVFSQPPDPSQFLADLCRRYRSKYALSGQLQKRDQTNQSMPRVELDLDIFGNEGEQVLAEQRYQREFVELAQLMQQAAADASLVLAKATGTSTIASPETEVVGLTAYDYYMRGLAEYMRNTQDSLREAARLYSMALVEEASYPLAHTGLSDVYTFQYMARYDHSESRLEAARLEAEKALKRNPTLPQAHRALGRYYQNKGNVTEAERYFFKALEYNPKYREAYRSLSWLMRSVANYEKAQEYVTKALDLGPTDTECLVLLGLLYQDQKQDGAALETFRRAITVDPRYGRGYYYLGNAYFRHGRLDYALKNLEKAIEFKGDPNCYIDAGYIHALRGEYDSAEKRFLESISDNHFPFAANYYLGMLMQMRNRPAEASNYLKEVIRLTCNAMERQSSEQHEIVFHAMAQARLGEKELALALLSIVEEKAQGSGELLYQIARTYALLSDKKRAHTYLEMAIGAHAGPSVREAAVDPHFAALRTDN